ncbi:MAG: DUF2017 family protein [Actinobacteria bacterium]|nr:MAG: DUF2017 family protein [Actinomycetota bacterium]
MTPRRVARRADGHFDLDLPPEERTLLRSLPASMRLALTEGTPADDPGLARLNPKAYPADDELEAEYRDLIGNELDAGRLAALDTLEATADAPTLDENQMEAWMRAINDTRLLLGTRLAVTEDRAGREVPDDHPDAQAIAVYDYLSWLEEQLVEALLD